jgi:hypothetical protein
MRTCLLTLLILPLLHSCRSNQGAPKQVTAIQYALDENGAISSKGDTIEVEYLDNHGRVIKRITRYESIGEVVEKTSTFDAKEAESTRLVKLGRLHTNKTDYLRNEAGHLVAMRTYDLNNNADTTTTEFISEYKNDSTFREVTAYFRGDSESKFFQQERYDDQGRLLLSQQYRLRGNEKILESEEEYRYDKNGNKVLAVEKNFSDSSITKTKYDYVSETNLMKVAVFQNDTLRSQMVYKYKNKRKAEAIVDTYVDKKRYLIRYFYE